MPRADRSASTDPVIAFVNVVGLLKPDKKTPDKVVEKIENEKAE